MSTLRSFHIWWGYVAIVVNGLIGLGALLAWRVARVRGRWLWIVTIVAEAAMMLQVVVGVVLVASKDYTVPRFHMFYGFLAFLTVGLAYQYRNQMRGRREMPHTRKGFFGAGECARSP